MARVTIVDVARAAGVMPSTVSKALNGGRGSAEVRARVEAAAAALGYRPNQRARGLRRSESRAIGVLVPDLANPVFLPFLRGAEHAARARGYTVLIADGERSDATAAAALERFFDQGVDGVLLGGPVTSSALALYREHGVAVAPSGSPADRAADRRWEHGEAAATRAMAERLLQLGHRRFAFLGTPIPGRGSGRRSSAGRAYGRSRVGALATVVEAADGAELVVHLIDPTEGEESAARGLAALFTDASTPTAVVCGNHLLAPWMLMALDAAGLRIPSDVSLVVYGDSDWARAYRPALSVVCHDTYADGVDLVTSLLDTIAGIDSAPRPVVAASYVERDSCATAKGRS
jgi:LacI family transcriptional regulator, galactose operon repressor